MKEKKNNSLDIFRPGSLWFEPSTGRLFRILHGRRHHRADGTTEDLFWLQAECFIQGGIIPAILTRTPSEIEQNFRFCGHI